MLCKRQTSKADHSQMMERMMNVRTRVARGTMMAQKELMDVLDAPAPEATARSVRPQRLCGKCGTPALVAMSAGSIRFFCEIKDE